MPIRSIKKQNITEEIFTQLYDTIVSGEWTPGTKIPSENELCDLLDVSRISVRGALNKLEGMGLIEKKRGSGTYVCELTSSKMANSLVPLVAFNSCELMNIMEFRKIFESEVAGLAAKRATDEDIEKLQKNYDRFVAVKNNLEKSAEYDADFHYLVAQACHNDLLIQIYDTFAKAYYGNMKTIVRKMGTSFARKCHKDVLNAIINHDEEKAREIMRVHINETIKQVQQN